MSRFAIPSSAPLDAAGNFRPEWRIFLQRLGDGLAAVVAANAGLAELVDAAGAVAVLDDETTYSADELRDKIIELQVALGAEV